MSQQDAEPGPKWVINREGIQVLLDTLAARGYRVLGPRLRDQAIVYDDIASLADLPAGWTDEQSGGHYRMARRDDGALFGYAVGPHSWKRFLHPPIQRLWHTRQEDGATQVIPEPAPEERLALVGVRACELHAIAIQDRVFLGGPHVDRRYAVRRRDTFVVAVNCSKAGGTCFCVSMHAGPKAESGFDLSLTELLDEDRHCFLAEAGSAEGEEVLDALAARAATAEESDAARQVTVKTAASMGRTMRSDDLHALLMGNLDHPRWDDVAQRCLTCANCTMVCPTCFCTSVEDSSDLTGQETARTQRWDSCFTIDYSYLHGGSVRKSPKSRYRQWMTHKLATWIDQFGTSGCVGCGRCITWCPVGIDITEEVAAIRRDERR